MFVLILGFGSVIVLIVREDFISGLTARRTLRNMIKELKVVAEEMAKTLSYIITEPPKRIPSTVDTMYFPGENNHQRAAYEALRKYNEWKEDLVIQKERGINPNIEIQRDYYGDLP